MSVKLIAAPIAEPVSLEEAKAHLRVLHTQEDSLIATYLMAARRYCEEHTARSFMPATWRYSLHEFPAVISLPKNPVQQIASLKYWDETGYEQTLAPEAYTPDLDSEPARIYAVDGWPATGMMPNAVQITFIAGYENAEAVPADIKIAILLLLGHFYENRSENVQGTIVQGLPFGVKTLLAPYIIY